MTKIQSGYLFRLLKVMLLQLFFFISLSGIAFSQNRPQVYHPNVSDIDKLKQSVEPLMKMSIEEVIAQVPSESGMYFAGCPN